MPLPCYQYIEWKWEDGQGFFYAPFFFQLTSPTFVVPSNQHKLKQPCQEDECPHLVWGEKNPVPYTAALLFTFYLVITEDLGPYFYLLLKQQAAEQC